MKKLIFILFMIFSGCAAKYEVVYRTPGEVTVNQDGWLYEMIDVKKMSHTIIHIDTIEYNIGTRFKVKNDTIIKVIK